MAAMASKVASSERPAAVMEHINWPDFFAGFVFGVMGAYAWAELKKPADWATQEYWKNQMTHITTHTMVVLLATGKGETWRGPLLRFFERANIKEPSDVLTVVADLQATGTHESHRLGDEEQLRLVRERDA